MPLRKLKLERWRHYMRLLKWAAILIPALLFVLIDIIWQTPLSNEERGSAEFIWDHVAITVAIIVVSYVIYSFIFRLQTNIVQVSRESAVIQERERTAREMHDGMGQLLGYINTQTIAVRTLLSKGQLSEAREELAKMEEIARDLYADVRQEMLGLRAVPDRQKGLIASLREYAARYSEIYGINVEINDATGVTCPRLNPSAELQLIRIIQEALTNVRKHASATNAVITFERNENGLCLTLVDNGRGFDTNNISPNRRPHFGLQVMKERAEAISGSFSIESSSGNGCRVSVCIPLSPKKQDVEVRV